MFDRQVALVNSNNINLRSNVEMMTRFEGDVVNSLYDTFVISWHTKLATPLPNIDKPTPARRDFIFGHDEHESQARESFDHNSSSNAQDNVSYLQNQLKRNQTKYSNEDHPEKSISVNKRLNVQEHIEQTATSEEANAFHPYTFHSRHSPVPMALVNRQPHNLPGHGDVINPQNNAWLAALKYARKSVFIQSPVCNATPIVAAIADACRRNIQVTVFTGLGFNDFVNICLQCTINPANLDTGRRSCSVPEWNERAGIGKASKRAEAGRSPAEFTLALVHRKRPEHASEV